MYDRHPQIVRGTVQSSLLNFVLLYSFKSHDDDRVRVHFSFRSPAEGKLSPIKKRFMGEGIREASIGMLLTRTASDRPQRGLFLATFFVNLSPKGANFGPNASLLTRSFEPSFDDVSCEGETAW